MKKWSYYRVMDIVMTKSFIFIKRKYYVPDSVKEVSEFTEMKLKGGGLIEGPKIPLSLSWISC